ncbi:conserved hypothetical protein [Hyphomicrobiales bacterium]|nr:conserved hypothetical protein [Hyphomicrobiales bacterium]CAH1665278.1 conserved hypothetical protein [Hyphomicrobiales bacterium]
MSDDEIAGRLAVLEVIARGAMWMLCGRAVEEGRTDLAVVFLAEMRRQAYEKSGQLPGRAALEGRRYADSVIWTLADDVESMSPALSTSAH